MDNHLFEGIKMSNRGVKAGTERGKYNTEGRDSLVGMVSVKVTLDDARFYKTCPDRVRVEIRDLIKRLRLASGN
jgi:hypothetical protein